MVALHLFATSSCASNKFFEVSDGAQNKEDRSNASTHVLRVAFCAPTELTQSYIVFSLGQQTIIVS